MQYTILMDLLISGISLVIKRQDSRRVIIIFTMFLFLLLLVVENGKEIFSLLSFNSIPIGERALLAVKTFFNVENSFTGGTLILAVLGSLLGGMNFSLAYTYMRLRGVLIIKSGIYNGIGLFLAFIGIGCAACGTALLSVLLSFLGFSAMLNFLPYQGQEIGYIGLIILLIATYTLARKVAGPNVC